MREGWDQGGEAAGARQACMRNRALTTAPATTCALIGQYAVCAARLVDEVVWVKMTVNRRLAKSHGYYLQHAKEVRRGRGRGKGRARYSCTYPIGAVTTVYGQTGTWPDKYPARTRDCFPPRCAW